MEAIIATGSSSTVFYLQLHNNFQHLTKIMKNTPLSINISDVLLINCVGVLWVGGIVGWRIGTVLMIRPLWSKSTAWCSACSVYHIPHTDISTQTCECPLPTPNPFPKLILSPKSPNIWFDPPLVEAYEDKVTLEYSNLFTFKFKPSAIALLTNGTGNAGQKAWTPHNRFQELVFPNNRQSLTSRCLKV